MAVDPDAVEVRDHPEEQRYEAWLGGSLAGFAAYRLRPGRPGRPGRIVFTHTEVQVEGRGVGSTLVRGALDDVRRRGLTVTPLCPFVKAYLEKHPEYADLM